MNFDKSMLDKLRSWCDRNRPNNQYIKYVNSKHVWERNKVIITYRAALFCSEWIDRVAKSNSFFTELLRYN